MTRSYDRSRALQAIAHRLIPGGCHTYAKGDDQFPEAAPGFIASGQGCHVVDVDGNGFIEYGMGLRAVTLGHAYPPVVEAVTAELARGANFTRPSPIEVDCARTLLECIGGERCVKFTKDGSAATSAAVRLARAWTGRDLVAICADHPFFSSEDWFIGTTAVNAGIPDGIRRLTTAFHYNDPEGLERLFQSLPGQIACVVMEPERAESPAPGYLAYVRDLCHREGALLVFDEMITGFRWAVGGAQQVHGVTADLTAYGKGMANGFALSALAGRPEIMQLGGLHHDRERVFLLSTTHGAETHAMAAGIATMREYLTHPVIETLQARGERLHTGIGRHVDALDLGNHFALGGRACNLHYVTLDERREPSQPFRTLFLQELLERGVIAPSLVVSYSHSEDDIDTTIAAAGEALAVYRRALDEGIGKYLRGRPVKPVYRRFN